MARKGQMARKRSRQAAQETAREAAQGAVVDVPGEDVYDSEVDYNDFDEDRVADVPKSKRKMRGLQVLPVAEIDEDWEGEPLDGATYLALAQRANLKLPSSTRVMDPYRAASPVRSSTTLAQSQASSSRHGALPTESWITSFRAHFQEYRKTVMADWPPKPRRKLPADTPPFPDFEHRHEWIFWICGYGRGQLTHAERERQRRTQTAKAFSPSRPSNEDEEVEVELGRSPVKLPAEPAAVEEEEEWLNEHGIVGPASDGEEGSDGSGELEDEGARHRPREPTLTILSHMGTRNIMTILIQISLRLSREIDLLSTHLSPSILDSPPWRPASLHPLPNIPATRHPNPFPSHLASWSFALLCVLDDHLLPEDIHHLRELARTLMRVGGWRYILAVQSGEVAEGWSINSRPPQGYHVDSVPGPEPREDDESGVDETLNRCWLVVNAIAAGWAQHDLLESLETLFR